MPSTDEYRRMKLAKQKLEVSFGDVAGRSRSVAARDFMNLLHLASGREVPIEYKGKFGINVRQTESYGAIDIEIAAM